MISSPNDPVSVEKLLSIQLIRECCLDRLSRHGFPVTGFLADLTDCKAEHGIISLATILGTNLVPTWHLK
jgi:hypothetical protein